MGLNLKKKTVFLLCFLHPPIALLGSISVADASELSVSEAADSSGGVHVLSDTLWWKRPLFDLSGPHQLYREERDTLVPPEELDQAERSRSAVTAGRLGPELRSTKSVPLYNAVGEFAVKDSD